MLASVNNPEGALLPPSAETNIEPCPAAGSDNSCRKGQHDRLRPNRRNQELCREWQAKFTVKTNQYYPCLGLL
jgi:hypothetical protein